MDQIYCFSYGNLLEVFDIQRSECWKILTHNIRVAIDKDYECDSFYQQVDRVRIAYFLLDKIRDDY